MKQVDSQAMLAIVFVDRELDIVGALGLLGDSLFDSLNLTQ